MTDRGSQSEIIEQLKNSQNNIKVFIAVPFGVMLCIYFFTFATLLDRGMHLALLFEFVTSIVFVLGIIFVNSLSFGLLKLKLGKQSPYQEVLSCLTSQDMQKNSHEIEHILVSRQIT